MLNQQTLWNEMLLLKKIVDRSYVLFLSSFSSFSLLNNHMLFALLVQLPRLLLISETHSGMRKV